MSDSRFQEMKRFVRFGADEASMVAAVGVVAAPSFRPIFRTVLERVRERGDARTLALCEAQVLRLESAGVRWLTRLCGGTYDEVYFEETATLGRVYARMGLEQRHMFSAMSVIRVALTEIAEREMGVDAARARSALLVLLDLELAILVEGFAGPRLAAAEAIERPTESQALAATDHRYESAVELARVMIIGVDAEGRIRLFNHEAEQVTGCAREQAIGQSFADLCIPEESRKALVACALASSHARDQSFTGVLATRSGHVRVVRWDLAAAHDVGGGIVLFAIGCDTTEEAALVERTRQHEKIAAIGTLAAGLAHELRNPLNGAQLHVAYLDRALRRAGAHKDLLDAVTVVGDEIKSFATFVTDFLDFARPKPLARQPLSVRRLCEHALELVAPEAAAQHVVLHEDLPTPDVMLEGDPDKLAHLLQNLLRNSIEASADANGSAVTLRAWREPCRVVLEVEDDGPGLTGQDTPIFDAFFSTKPAGTGLGLAITHRIVTDHAGTIDVDSGVGRTIFRVTLPLGSSERSINEARGET